MRKSFHPGDPSMWAESRTDHLWWAPLPPTTTTTTTTTSRGSSVHCLTALLSGFTPLYFANDTVALSTFRERETDRTAQADINNTSTHAGSGLLQTHGVSGTGTKLEQDGTRDKGRLFCGFIKAVFSVGSPSNSITTGKHCSVKAPCRKRESSATGMLTGFQARSVSYGLTLQPTLCPTAIARKD